MTAFISSVFGVLEILILIAIGYFLTARGWFNDHSSKIIAKVVTQVALPAYMIVTIASKFTAPMLLRLLPDLFFPVLSMMILFALSFLVCYLLKVPHARKGTFKSMFLTPTQFLSACLST